MNPCSGLACFLMPVCPIKPEPPAAYYAFPGRFVIKKSFAIYTAAPYLFELIYPELFCVKLTYQPELFSDRIFPNAHANP
jgi:hypothetical protein